MSVRFDAPDTWPLGRVLPVVKRGDGLFPALGLLLAGHGPTVYLCRLAEATPERLRCCGFTAYTDFATLAGDWRVD